MPGPDGFPAARRTLVQTVHGRNIASAHAASKAKRADVGLLIFEQRVQPSLLYEKLMMSV